MADETKQKNIYTLAELTETQQELYDEYVRDIVEDAYMDPVEKHFMLQHLKIFREGWFNDDKWRYGTTLEAGPGGDNYPQYIVYVDVKFSDEYKVKIDSYKGCFIDYDQEYQDYQAEDDENTYYAYNMFKDFEFRDFTGEVTLRGI